MPRTSNTTLPFGRHGTDWIEALRVAGRSVSTIDCYARDLRDIASALKTEDATVFGRVQQSEIDRLAEIWLGSGASSGTVARRFSAFRQFALYLTRHRGIDCGRGLAADFPVHDRPVPANVHFDEVRDFISPAAADIEDWMSVRDTAIFTIQAGLGLTTFEAVSLNRCDIGGATIEVANTVFRKRTVGLSDEGRLGIDRYLKVVPFDLAFDGPLFVNSRGSRVSERTMQVRSRHRAAIVGGAKVSGPTLRRNAGRALVLQGQPPDAVAQALGLHPLSVFRFFDLEGCS